jgi:hypothetical protein
MLPVYQYMLDVFNAITCHTHAKGEFTFFFEISKFFQKVLTFFEKKHPVFKKVFKNDLEKQKTFGEAPRKS